MSDMSDVGDVGCQMCEIQGAGYVRCEVCCYT